MSPRGLPLHHDTTGPLRVWRFFFVFSGIGEGVVCVMLCPELVSLAVIFFYLFFIFFFFMYYLFCVCLFSIAISVQSGCRVTFFFFFFRAWPQSRFSLFWGFVYFDTFFLLLQMEYRLPSPPPINSAVRT